MSPAKNASQASVHVNWLHVNFPGGVDYAGTEPGSRCISAAFVQSVRFPVHSAEKLLIRLTDL